MLSTENPPPDLCEISQLISGDENKQQLEVDLFKSAGLDYNNPLPNFSIRDYVFNTRIKDINTNWPFSQKNLQLCLKHGAKDLLPPFQSLDSVRNPSVEEPVVDSFSNGENYQRPAVNIENINSSGCEEDPSTTSQSLNSVPRIRNSCSEPEAEYLLSDKPEFTVKESKRAESNIQSPAKKYRLTVKLNNIAEPGSDEYSICVVSEAMASKVCPVCKTFSSSSNTTLNAHIDQCLSVESTANWTENSKVIKHRIKPRKTRLMVDIYETALHSTLEDLDKRNGTKWASNMGLDPQDLDACAEEAYYPAEDINQEGAVYIDSSGTKLRILSKFSHLPPKSDTNDSGPCKFVKRDTGIKLLSNKKKKHIVQKLQLQNNCLDGQGSCSPFLHGSKTCYSRVEVNDSQHKLYPPEGHKEDDPTKSPIASHMKSDDFGMIKQWVGSKRTGLKKKINLELENQLPDKSLKNLRRSVSSISDRGNSALISPISSDENPVLPSESLKRKENLSRSDDGRTELPCKRKEPKSSLLRSKHLSDKKIHLMSSRFNVKHSRKDNTSVHERPRDPPNRTVSSCGNKKMRVISRATVKCDSSFIGSSMSRCHASPFEGKNATPLRKMPLGHAISTGGRRSKLLSVRHASGAELKKNLRRELLNFKKPRFRCMLLSDEEADEDDLAKALGESATLMEKNSSELQTNRTRVLKIREKIEGFVSSGEGGMTSKGSETSSESDSYKVGNKIVSFVRRSAPVDTSTVLEEDAEMLDDFVLDPASTDEEAFVSFSKSLDSTFAGCADSNVERVSQYCSKAYDGHCPTDLVFHADQEMLSAENVGNTLVTHEMAEMNGGDEAQGNYFADVDPIPIPGPPGSFLPSPERMGSEELLGHSSLTTCRIQSSEDGHEVVDMDSSDSSISAMSAMSNSAAGRSTPNLSAQSHFQHKNQFDIPEKRINPVVDGQIANGEREVNLLKSESNLMLPELQPCCCSRKDVSLQGGSLNYQELQILRRRTMTSLSVLGPDDVDNGFGCYGFGAETFAVKEPTHVTKKEETNSPMAYSPVPVPHNSEALILTPTSNPVLRLMGKNLMVVNKDEDNLSPQTQPIQSSMMIENISLRENGISTRNKPSPFHNMVSRGPSIFDSMQSLPAAQQQYDAFKIPTSHPSTPMFGDNATSGSKIKPDFQTYAMEEMPTPCVHHLKTTDSSAGKHKEITVIDDSPENEAGLAVRATHCSRDVEAREALGHAASMLFPPDSRHVNPFYSYQMRVINPHFAGSPVVANRNSTIAPPSNGLMKANLGKWACIPEGSTALHSKSSSASSLPSSVHLRSKYFSPRFS